MTQRTRRGPVPIRKQIIDDLRASIASGKLQPGQQLPPERELMATYGASSQTIRKTLRELREEGLIYSRGRAGRFVGPEDAAQTREMWPYEQIAAAVAEQIRAGRYAPGEALSTESEMQLEFGAARTTVRRAVKLLREQGWVFTVHPMGTFVSNNDKWPPLVT